MARRRLFLISVFTILILVTSTSNASAQQASPGSRSDNRLAGSFPIRQSEESQGSSSPSAVPLGQPGLNFHPVQTYGITGAAYPADPAYLNRPKGIYVDGSGDVFVTEDWGYRVLGYRSDGSLYLNQPDGYNLVK